ncbi:MAG: branched-chain amino acid aminotransferase [SAR202 cluster bacterium]|nr:branched-chain amino acid aminotransferase [SAR202 cluster bacterium]
MAKNEPVAYLTGEWVPLSELKVHVHDRGFYIGDTVFDLARTFNGKSFKMKEHIDRLFRSMKAVRIDPGLSPEEMVGISEECVRRNEHLRKDAGDWHVWQAVTRGVAGWRELPTKATVIIQCVPIPFKIYASQFRTGAHTVIARTRSYSADTIDPKVKHYSRMNFNMADLEARDVDPQGWPLLLDQNGNLTEGTAYNVFIVSNGVIRTPGDNALLQGISRGAVAEIAERLNIPIVQEELQPYDLYTADEAFITNTPMCALPVTRADNRTIGDGKPGPITQQLLAAWSEWVGMDIVDQAERYAKR